MVYNLTISEVELLETIDLLFLRQLLGAPKGTPKEMFYLELGIIPFRDIIRARRLNFLHTILNEESNSLVSRFFKAQLEYKSKKDWVSTVLEDLEYLELNNVGLEGIKIMKKQAFRKLVDKKVEDMAFRKLENTKRSHSKVNKIEHNSLIMQKYLQPNKTNIKKEEAQLIFILRCRVTKVKNNMKGNYDSLSCRGCKIAEESQKHIVEECKILNKDKQEIQYEKILTGTIQEKLKIARIFQENFKKLEEIND